MKSAIVMVDMMKGPEPFELFALCYARHTGRFQSDNFLGGAPGEPGDDLNFYIWVARRSDHVFVIDTGFTAEAGAKRGRRLLREPSAVLGLMGIDAAQVESVILTHLHYDHAGTLGRFSKARFHVQDAEVAYATGRCMCEKILKAPYDAEDVAQLVSCLHHGRVHFHDGFEELAPGLTLHRIGGHSDGLQVVRVWTKRGFVVIASDATHFYANLFRAHSFPIVYDLPAMLAGFKTVRELADSPDHIVPGHDPWVMQAYLPPSPELAGIAVRLDEAPVRPWRDV